MIRIVLHKIHIVNKFAEYIPKYLQEYVNPALVYIFGMC